MKKMFFNLAAIATCLCVTLSAMSNAQENDDSLRKAYSDGFEQLLKNTEEGLLKPAIVEQLTKNGSGESITKFAIASVAVPVTTTTGTVTSTPCNLGVKIWFQLEDGTCFNPVKRKMGVKEKFYVHVQAAVPVYVALFQNYPDSRPVSKQVYPDKKYPESFKAIQTGKSTRLPVLFEMDDDTRDEIMSMVVVRADAPQVQTTLTARATTSITTTTTGTTVTAESTGETLGTMKSINDLAVEGKEPQTKFAISAPAPTVTVTTATTPNDVAFYMFGAGYVGQWQLTLKK